MTTAQAYTDSLPVRFPLGYPKEGPKFSRELIESLIAVLPRGAVAIHGTIHEWVENELVAHDRRIPLEATGIRYDASNHRALSGFVLKGTIDEKRYSFHVSIQPECFAIETRTSLAAAGLCSTAYPATPEQLRAALSTLTMVCDKRRRSRQS